MDNCWWLTQFHYPGHSPKKGDANTKRSFVWFEANQSSFHSFSLNYLEKKGCNELRGRKKRLLLSLDTFTLQPRNGGMRPLRLWQNSWSHGMCRNPTDPQLFLNMKRFIPQSSQALHVSTYLLKKICAIKLSGSCFHYDDNHCLWYPWRGQSRTSNVGSYEAQPLDTDDTWSYGLHRRKWNNCNGMAILSFRNLSNTCGFSRSLLRWCLKIQFDTLHLEACSLLIPAMEPWTFCKWSFFLKKEWFSIFSVQFLHTKHWLLTYLIFPCPMRTTERLYNIPWIYPSNSHHQNRHCWVRRLDPKHPLFLSLTSGSNRIASVPHNESVGRSLSGSRWCLP